MIRVADIPDGEGVAVRITSGEVAVFRCGSALHAIGNRCPHAGGPLSDGIVAGATVTCPLHGRRVDLHTGSVDDCDEDVPVYAVDVVDGAVVVRH